MLDSKWFECMEVLFKETDQNLSSIKDILDNFTWTHDIWNTIEQYNGTIAKEKEEEEK